MHRTCCIRVMASFHLRSVNGLTSTPAEVCAILNKEFAKNFDNLQLEATVPNNVLLADQTPCCGRPMSTTTASLSDINQRI